MHYQRRSLSSGIMKLHAIIRCCSRYDYLVIIVACLDFVPNSGAKSNFSKQFFLFEYSVIGLTPGGGALPYMGYIGMCRCDAVKGMVFKQFTLG